MGIGKQMTLYNGENTLVIIPEPLTEEEREAQEDQETFEAEQKLDTIKQDGKQ
jgi:hypothetical protein